MFQVVDIVCAIISAYTGAAALLQARKERKESKRKQKEELDLERSLQRSLVRSPPRLRGEYDHDFAKLGKVFARGDGKNFPLQFLALVLRGQDVFLLRYCMHRILGMKERLWLTFIVS
jgi:hypothetical protein